MINKSIKPYFVFISLFVVFILSLISPAPIKAQTLIFQDDFNDNNSDSWEEFNPQGYWLVDNGSYIGSCVSRGYSERQSYSITGNKEWDNYIFEVDIKGLQGVDKEILFRVNENGRAYVLNMRSPYFGGGNDILLAKRERIGYEQVSLLKSVRFENIKNQTYKIKVEVINLKNIVSIRVYIDDIITPTLEYLDINNPIFNGSIGFEVWPGGYQIPTTNLRTTTLYDNVKVFSISDKYLLNVTDLKQFSSPWGQLEYDTASKWYPSNPKISRWGCALTSASMLLKYYGHDINPDSLNEWLNAQKDGYTRTGGIIWPTVSRLTEYRWLANHDWPILEFAYLTYSENKLKDEIKNERPGILKLSKPIYDKDGNITSYSTHFIVGRGYNESDILINDPGKDGHTTLAQANSYWGSTSKIGRFKKSETDLSYIVLFVDDGFDIEVSDENRVITGDEYYFKEYPMSDPENPDLESGIESLNAFYYPKPESGEYKVKITGEGVYRLDYYIYDETGESKIGNSFSSVQEGQSDEYVIIFDKTISDDSSVPEISFESILSFWEEAYGAGLIQNNGLYTSIKRLLENAYRTSSRNLEASRSLLEEILFILDDPEYEFENEDVLSFLKFQVENMISSLQ